MRAAWGAHTETDDDSPPGTAMCLAAAAGNLAAGRDLLHTHFTTDQFGWRHGTSPWAPAIASLQVNGALVGEIGSYAGHLAAGALQLAAAGSAERLPARAPQTRRWASPPHRQSGQSWLLTMSSAYFNLKYANGTRDLAQTVGRSRSRRADELARQPYKAGSCHDQRESRAGGHLCAPADLGRYSRTCDVATAGGI
jgi:hypothetical protein